MNSLNLLLNFCKAELLANDLVICGCSYIEDKQGCRYVGRSSALLIPGINRLILIHLSPFDSSRKALKNSE